MNITEFRRDISKQLNKAVNGEQVVIERGGVTFKVVPQLNRESGLVAYAESELKRIGMGKDTPDEYNKLMHDSIIELVQTFADQGHSGFSAGYALSIATKLMNYEALTPLTGEDDEWMEIPEEQGSDDMKWQNRRCYSVFKGSDGRAYDSGSKVYYEKGNRDNTYQKGGQRDYITFPYTHKVEYVEDPENVEAYSAPKPAAEGKGK